MNGVITEEGGRFSDGCRDYRKRRKVNDEKYNFFLDVALEYDNTDGKGNDWIGW